MRAVAASLFIAAMFASAIKGQDTTTTSVTTSTVTASPAPLVTDDPPAAHYQAIFPQGGSQSIQGLCDAETPINTSVGTLFTFNINGSPQDCAGPYLYHVHEYPVPANGSCDATGEHLDPQNRTENPPCDATQSQTCQVGDLSGKYGDIPAIPGFYAKYVDDYCSLNPDDPAFIGNRSLVIHCNNGTRLACANWAAVTNATNSTYFANATTTSSATTTGTSVVGSAMTNAETATTTTTSATHSSTGNSTSGATSLAAGIGKTMFGFGPLAAIAAALMV